MKPEDITPGMIVSYWVWAGTSKGSCTLGYYDHYVPVFGKVLSVGKVFATVLTETGERQRIQFHHLSPAPEGAEYFPLEDN